MNNTSTHAMCQNHAAKHLNAKPSVSMDIAQRMLNDLMSFRRVTKGNGVCQMLDCQKCAAPHVSNIRLAVSHHQPVIFVLPAFPGKSPNLEKVLGPLPDYAERLALCFLGSLCQQVKTYYAPGIKIMICSDGRVFSDVIGMKEEDVTRYQAELAHLINELSLPDLHVFHLDNVCDTPHFDDMRNELMKDHGQSLEAIKQHIRNGAQSSATVDEQELNRMYRGITRFLFEDALHQGQTKSRSALQNESRMKAYEVVRRSQAWSSFIAQRFPHAVRLSIHPQGCGAKKLGIRLIENEIWMTPWHGVAVETKQGYILRKRKEAEAMGAKLMYSATGAPSHYQLITLND